MLKAGAYFVAGTDTEVGKSFTCAALLRAAARAQWQTQAFKPVAAGCGYNPVAQRWENEDALLLQAAATQSLPYEVVNPIALKAACSPHIAAAAEKCEIDPKALAQTIHRARSPEAKLVIVEGAGGWYAPISDRLTMADVAVALQYPVILVVGLRLGCLSHARLTEQAIRDAGLPVAGWVACQVAADMPFSSENIDWLRGALRSSCLGLLPWFSGSKTQASLQFKHLFAEEVVA